MDMSTRCADVKWWTSYDRVHTERMCEQVVGPPFTARQESCVVRPGFSCSNGEFDLWIQPRLKDVTLFSVVRQIAQEERTDTRHTVTAVAIIPGCLGL